MKPGYTSYIANLSAQQAQVARVSYGVDVRVAGHSEAGGRKSQWLRMMTRPLKGTEGEFLPQGLLNATASDLRLFNASPADFTAANVLTLPPAGSSLTWDGNDYTVIFAVTSDMSGIPVSIKIFAYRTPLSDNATTETAAEAVAEGRPSDAGKRRSYSPAPTQF